MIYQQRPVVDLHISQSILDDQARIQLRNMGADSSQPPLRTHASSHVFVDYLHNRRYLQCVESIFQHTPNRCRAVLESKIPSSDFPLLHHPNHPSYLSSSNVSATRLFWMTSRLPLVTCAFTGCARRTASCSVPRSRLRPLLRTLALARTEYAGILRLAIYRRPLRPLPLRRDLTPVRWMFLCGGRVTMRLFPTSRGLRFQNCALRMVS